MILALVVMPMNVRASGFAVTDLAASAAGAANAVVAGADDVSAVAYNPSGLAWHEGTLGMLSMSLPYRHASVDRGAIGTSPNKGKSINIYHAYGSWMPHESDLGFALGYYRAYEMDNSWQNAFPNQSGQSVFRADRVSFDAIYRISSNMAVAAGADWYLSNLTIARANQLLSGTDYKAFGSHLSGKWKPLPHLSLGFLARLGSKVTVDGGNGSSAEVIIPDEFRGGIAYDLFDAFRLELDGSLIRWGAFKNLNITNGSTVVQGNPLYLRDTLSVMAGATWFWRERTTLRAGYAYDMGASGKLGYNPMVADQPTHKFSVGFGGDLSDMHIDASFYYDYTTPFEAKGSYAGTYRNNRYSYLFSFSRRF